MSSHVVNIVILFLLVVCNSLCDICKTCVCSIVDAERIVDCREKHLETNKILNFELFTLDNHQHLDKLILSRNNITLLPTHVLRKLKHLKKLDVSQNCLNNTYVNSIFEELKELEDLDYSNNLLWTFDISMLNAVPSLTKLNLSHNHINSLEKYAQNVDTKLKILDLSCNNLTDLGGNFLDSLAQLRYLDLSFNKLINLQESLLNNLQHLKILRVNNNQLHSLDLQDLPSSLIELHAGDNSINILLLKKSSVRVLNIENNQISELREDLTLLEELRHLNLSGNYLSDFSSASKRIELLDLSFNNLSIIPKAISIQNFPMLRTLNVSGNNLKNMNVYSELRLEVFEANFIETFEEIIAEMFLKLKERKDSCINVTISNCTKLSVIGENVFQHMNVCSLDLSNNGFTYLSPRLIDNNKNNVTYLVNVQGNPFVCDCSLQWMLDDLVPLLYKTKPNLLENLRCAGPPPLTNRRLVHWYQWQNKVFCDKLSERIITVNIAETSGRTVTFETSPGMLAVLGTTIVVLTVLTIIGILLTRKMITKRRRFNRRF